MRPEKKIELLVYLIGFFISFGFAIFTTLNMIEAQRIEQEVARRLRVPVIYDPYIPMFILFSLAPTLFFLGGIFKVLWEMNRA